MNRELYAFERRRERRRDLKGLLALVLWGGGCYLLYLAWHARTGWSERHADAIGTAIYLATFFYLFAFWPIQAAVERLFGRPPPAPQEGGSPISGARSAAGTARKSAGGASSPGAGS